MAVELSTREVVVERTNDRGFKSTDGDWWNVSKYAAPGDVVMPSVGARVVISLDRSGFVRKVTAPASAPIAGQTAPQTPTGPMAGHTTPTPAPASAAPDATYNAGVVSSPPIAQDAKGTIILRMNVMTTATSILASGGRPVNADEVLALAGRLEAWAIR